MHGAGTQDLHHAPSRKQQAPQAAHFLQEDAKMKSSFLGNLLVALLATTATQSLALPIDDGQAANATSAAADLLGVSPLPRLAIYFQTTHSSATGRPISMLPLVTEKGIALTHLYVCTLHVNYDGEIHLNDFPPGHARFATLWREAAVLRRSGVRVMAMVGGAAEGSFSRRTLDAPDGDPNFEKYYGQLRDVLRDFGLQGLDVDVEQPMSLRGAVRLVRRLREDFGPDFVLTQAPVGTALSRGGTPNLSGFSYRDLDQAVGGSIEFYNAQFYNGFGDMATTAAYDSVVAAGWDPRRIVAGQITTPANGQQFVPFDQLRRTMDELRARYGEIGGIMGWEYFNGKPGGESEPWEWAQEITAILRPDVPTVLTVSQADADELDEAWAVSVAAQPVMALGTAGVDPETPDVDYQAMVNA
ncbi:hypothetical protein MCOR17_006495 [Pyricularia oryzae]|nr:hypothetical protein MCOR17_006495 [Pyricularia oryzae]